MTTQTNDSQCVSRFTRYLLRTTDVQAAAAFYDAVIGNRGDGIVLLHEAALARGARPHWLGHLQVAECGGIEAVVARFLERGAERLGPPPGVGDFVIVRDSGGAVIAVTENAAESSARVVWHQLSTRDADRAAASYADLFGWTCAKEMLDLGPLGRHRRFAYGEDSSFAGQIAGIEGRPEIHAHWLFFFAIPSLDEATDRVRELGGTVLGPMALTNGVRIAVCEDAQGAAFGLIEPEHGVTLANG